MSTLKPLPLDEYHAEVSEHLQFIEHGASMIARRVGMLSRRPGFHTRAEDDMNQAEQVLEQALAKVRAAKTTFNAKPAEMSHAS